MNQEAAPGAQGPAAADFENPGIIFGFRAIADYGDFSDGQGHVYYFGRSKQQCMLGLDLSGEQHEVHQGQKDMLRKRMRCLGLNSPSRVLLWVRVQDLEKRWDEFRDQLRGWRDERDAIEGTSPLITNVLALGDNWYTVENLGPEDFGTWCKAMMQKILHPPRVFTIDIEWADPARTC
jgi:hypothetical protein